MLTKSVAVDLLLIAIACTIAMHIYYQMRRRRWMVCDPLNPFWGGVLSTYLLQTITYYDSLVSLYSLDMLLKTLFMVWWSTFFVIMGYESKLGQRLGLKLPSLPPRLRPVQLFGSAIFVMFLGLTGYAYLIGTAGGVSAWISVGRGGTNYAEVSGYIASLEHFFPAGIIMFIFCAEFFAQTTSFKVFAWCLGALTWLWFVYLGTRSRTILFLMMLMAAYYVPRRKNPRVALLIPVAAGLFLLTSFQLVYRGQFTDFSFHLDNLNWAEVKAKILPRALGGERDSKATTQGLGDLEMNCAMAVVEQVPSYVPYNYGYPLLEIVTHAIPRQIWSSKRYPMYEAQAPIMENRDLSRRHLPPPNETLIVGPSFTFLGYWYHAGGIIALTIAGFFTGAGFRMIRQFLDRDPYNQGNMIFYSLIFVVGFYEAASTPLYWVFSLPIVWIPVIILLKMSRRRGMEEEFVPSLQM